MTKYHINSYSGTPSPCFATIRACPVGGDHYPTEAEARAAVEKHEEATHGLFATTFSKKARAEKRTAEAKKKEAAALRAVFVDRLGVGAGALPSVVMALEWAMRANGKVKSTGAVADAEPREMALLYHDTYAEPWRRLTNAKRVGEDGAIILEKFGDLVERHELHRGKFYKPSTDPSALAGLSLTEEGEVRVMRMHQELKKIFAG